MNNKTIRVHVEFEPRPAPVPAGVLLNRPAPTGGAFLISQRLPREDWDAAKAAGAWYMDADELEEMDMFFSDPGWRYPLAALEALIARGYSLDLRDQTIATVDALRAMFTDEAVAAYHAAVKAAEEAAAQARLAAGQAEAEDARVKRAEYETWKAENLAGLVRSTVYPDGLIAQYNRRGVEWLHFEAGWVTTGDSYTAIETDHGPGWLCSYGNAHAAYVPQATADDWYAAKWDKDKEDPRRVLERLTSWLTSFGHVHGGDYEEWLAQTVGEDALAEIARQANPIRVRDYHVVHYAAAADLAGVTIEVTDRKLENGHWVDYVKEIRPPRQPMTAEERESVRQKSAQLSETFSAMFGG